MNPSVTCLCCIKEPSTSALNANANIVDRALIQIVGLVEVRESREYYESVISEYVGGCPTCAYWGLVNALDAYYESELYSDPKFLDEEFREGV